MAFQIHRDSNPLSRSHVAISSVAAGRVHLETVKGTDQARPHGAAVVPAKGNAGDFKPRTVMALRSGRDQLGGGVLGKSADR